MLLTRHITMPRPEAEFLTNVKLGKFEYKGLAAILEDEMEGLAKIKEDSDLPDVPDRELIYMHLMGWMHAYLNREATARQNELRTKIAGEMAGVIR